MSLWPVLSKKRVHFFCDSLKIKNEDTITLGEPNQHQIIFHYSRNTVRLKGTAVSGVLYIFGR
jgi:hypothetical protein